MLDKIADTLNSLPLEIRQLIPPLMILLTVLMFAIPFRKEQRLRNNYKKIQLGQTSSEVIKLLGRPNRKRKLKNNTVRYEWYYDTPMIRFKFAGQTFRKTESLHRFVSVTFANDHVIGVDSANMNG